MDLEEIGINPGNWVDSTQDRDYWRALVNAALNLRVPWAMELELELYCGSMKGLIIVRYHNYSLGTNYLTKEAKHSISDLFNGKLTKFRGMIRSSVLRSRLMGGWREVIDCFEVHEIPVEWNSLLVWTNSFRQIDLRNVPLMILIAIHYFQDNTFSVPSYFLNFIIFLIYMRYIQWGTS